MSNKPTLKMKINEVEYLQIRKDQAGVPIWWKNKPILPANALGSGLHFISEVGAHYDFYEGGTPLTKKELLKIHTVKES